MISNYRITTAVLATFLACMAPLVVAGPTISVDERELSGIEYNLGEIKQKLTDTMSRITRLHQNASNASSSSSSSSARKTSPSRGQSGRGNPSIAGFTSLVYNCMANETMFTGPLDFEDVSADSPCFNVARTVFELYAMYFEKQQFDMNTVKSDLDKHLTDLISTQQFEKAMLWVNAFGFLAFVVAPEVKKQTKSQTARSTEKLFVDLYNKWIDKISVRK